MKRALQLNIFSTYESTQKQLDKLNQLEKDNHKVTKEDELKSRKDMIKAIKESKEIANLVACAISHHTRGSASRVIRHHTSLSTEYKLLEQLTNVIFHMRMALQRLDELLQRMQAQDIRTETIIRVCLHVVSTSEKDRISELLVKIANGDTASFDPTIVQQVKSALNALIKDGIKLKKVQQECDALYLSCTTPKKWIHVCGDCLDGSLTELFEPLQTCLRTLPECQNLELKVVINENDFLVAMAVIRK
ncbi:hypothetical protein DPMN_092626 [Dreissena polymorpha]|uniref:Uncharacterized protein n=1 Tax=Dreissena polymorpha TaxID=45954 RepID=A0A9D4L2T5_DREPO|nr:hypothetical protein DPMN_092626 [Dreissena polymorpha]